ncbi:MAG: H/ACA ribonucleoprotein complex subunit GAR1 [Candidatus Bathycorpusculaceae bacterium]
MQRLGRVLHITPSRNIIVRIENLPKIGENVVDENLKSIGKVFDILGPISSPYAAVKPTIQEIERLTDKVLYVSPFPRRREKA